jgi:hypothetical protein
VLWPGGGRDLPGLKIENRTPIFVVGTKTEQPGLGPGCFDLEVEAAGVVLLPALFEDLLGEVVADLGVVLKHFEVGVL